MTDNELYNYLQSKHYSLTVDEYYYICDNCLNLDHIKYMGENKFAAWSNSGCMFEFEVKYFE